MVDNGNFRYLNIRTVPSLRRARWLYGSLACLVGSTVAVEAGAQPDPAAPAAQPSAQSPDSEASTETATAPGSTAPVSTEGSNVAPSQPIAEPAAPDVGGAPGEGTAESLGGRISGTSGAEAAADTNPAASPEGSVSNQEPVATGAASLDAEDGGSDEASIDLDALLGSDVELPGEEYRLQLYGFTDFTFSQPLAEQSFLSPYSTFWVGNFNLYIGSELGRNWRTLAEVRFTYLPHGQPPYTDTTQPRADTHVGDYADYDRPIRWGGIEIERAWLEYTLNNWLSIRAGQWLTPYGIWNVDHGSPVIVGVVRPYVVGDALFPERQTGIQLHGGTQLGSTQLGYHLTVSNGRGPIDSYRDLDKNKALGWRLFMRNESSIGNISLGFSGYWGRFTDSLQEFVPDGEGFKLSYDVQTQFDELALAGDIKYEIGDYFLQSEVIANHSRFTDEGRPVVPAFAPGASDGFAPDMNRWGVYGLTGYRTPWLGIMPFAGAEYYRFGTSYFPLTAAWYVGLNVRPIPRVVLKAQYTHSWYPDNEEFDGARLLAFQAAWSF